MQLRTRSPKNHDADECRSEFDRQSSKSVIEQGTKVLTSMETRLKSLIRQKEQVMVELSKVDMPSSNITA